LLTLVERKTQLAKITKLPRATARATQKAAVRRLQPIGDFVHTITFDNGKEFAAHQDIAPCTENQNLLRHAVSRMGARFK
jgi:IS30 family transposase